MVDQLASAMATIVFIAVLLVMALFHIDRIHERSTVSGAIAQMAVRR
jgi:hypothetical protein